MEKAVILAGTFDTKGEEYGYVRSLFEELGIPTILIDTGTNAPSITPTITAGQVAAAAGYDIETLRAEAVRGKAVKAMMEGLKIIVPALYQGGVVAGMVGLGGSGGTSILTPAMRKLPFGVPKIMVSTMAGGNVAPYVGNSDMIMIPSIVDIAGLNKISRVVFRGAVQAMSGLLGCTSSLSEDQYPDKPRIAATMYGVTTPCVMEARRLLEERGYEVIIFHASGNGGRTMEQLIDAGAFCGVLDITTTEWCDELYGGIMAAGTDRSEAAARNHIPQVVSVGAMDMVTFGPPETVPDHYKDRNLYPHNPMVTIMRTNVEENIALGKKLAEKLNLAQDNTILLLPMKGVSAVDAQGKVFYGPEEDKALFETLKEHVDTSRIPVLELNCHINDKEFPWSSAMLLLEMIEK